MTTVRSQIEEKLTAAFQPERLAVVDESELHVHHGHGLRGETHMRVRIVSQAFSGMSRLARHRAVNEVLRGELDAGLHALAVEPAAPGEPVRW